MKTILLFTVVLVTTLICASANGARYYSEEDIKLLFQEAEENIEIKVLSVRKLRKKQRICTPEFFGPM